MYSTTGQAPGMDNDPAETSFGTLPRARAWSDEQRRGVIATARELLAQIPPAGFFAAGLSGAPGTGKSTLARLVCELARSGGTETLVMSLDDYYLSRKERAQYAARHPLFAQRGVPGTHDWDRLIGDFDRIRAGDCEDLRLPRFDKASDDRVPQDRFYCLDNQPRVVILEGWMIGAPPQGPEALHAPVNTMEREMDVDGGWRKGVNAQLARYHGDLESRLDRKWFLAAPDWAHVIDWRWQQEREVSASGNPRHLGDRGAVEAFLQHFERIARHMHRSCASWADTVIAVDRAHVMRPV